jgi:hypothetical protein
MSVSRLKGVSRWVDQRTAVNDLWRSALDEPIRGGARWAHVFGSTLYVNLEDTNEVVTF